MPIEIPIIINFTPTHFFFISFSLIDAIILIIGEEEFSEMPTDVVTKYNCPSFFCGKKNITVPENKIADPKDIRKEAIKVSMVFIIDTPLQLV